MNFKDLKRIIPKLKLSNLNSKTSQIKLAPSFRKEFIKLKDGSVVTDGNSRIRDLNKFLGWSIPEENSKTINGLITEYLDQIPQANLCVEISDYKFEVLEIDDNSIVRIKIRKGK